MGEGGSLTRSGSETDEGSVSAERTPHPALRALRMQRQGISRWHPDPAGECDRVEAIGGG
ncbi:hypothetical protein LMTR13_37770 [Bradyrhizobium icense]|uniref:Uncharacterized protein n=1 Tax=Bradyrhizobium icense TaxID=1274631 RepID=A0A1B1UQC4_9BRAD|nr:hypothetical protein LMTR13_37770 [Bradyrhizobium icense]